jgi:hydrogenase maturation protein HypF
MIITKMNQLLQLSTFRIDFFGHVQGVGLRPFMYNLASELFLKGEIYNHSLGATAEITGSIDQIESFKSRIMHEAKKPIQIKKILSHPIESIVYADLKILSLEEQVQKLKERGLFDIQPLLSITPDRATCSDCWSEFRDPQHRMFQYPFISCTACGPRWTVIKELPFERDHTSYIDFPLCTDCEKEWYDPKTRRFNAQTLSCKTCGPKLELLLPDETIKENIWERISDLLNQGLIGVIKGLGGYQLVANALDLQVIQKMRLLKNRPEQAIAIMVKDFETFLELKGFSSSITEIELSEVKKQWEIMTSAEGPILSQKLEGLKTARELAPDLCEVGVMAPTTPLHYLLFSKCKVLMITSANDKGCPIPKTLEELTFELGKNISFVLNHNREIIRTVDDSVVKDQIILRKSRGFAPSIFPVPENKLGSQMLNHNKTILALGTDLKNSFSIANKEQIYEFPYAGNLHELKTIEKQKSEIQSTLNLLKIEPEIILKDIHPQSMTQVLVGEGVYTAAKHIKVPHHLAHAYSAFSENIFDIVLTFDGTGFDEALELRGSDAFLMRDESILFCLKPTPIIGGDSSIYFPWKSLVTNLALRGVSYQDIEKIINPEDLNIFYEMSLKLPGPLCSSMGRWFDSAAALIEFGSKKISYEAQAPIRLESLATEYIECENFTNSEELPEDLLTLNQSGVREIDGGAILEQLMRWKLSNKYSQSQLAFLAHDQMAKAISLAISCLSREKVRDVAATGGVFQNDLFFKRLEFHLSCPIQRSHSFAINDQSIALGQIFWFQSTH